MAEKPIRRRLAAVLAADVVGYSRLMGQDEAGTMASLRARRKVVLQPIVARHQGRIFKVTGDGVLVEFGSAVNAVQCAIELQHGMAAANADVPELLQIVLRIGINLGDVMVEGNDLYGDGINISARLESLAEPGGILVSGTAFDYVKNKVNAGFSDLGTQSLKNIADPVRIYRIQDTPRAPAIADLAAKPSIAVLPFTNMSGDSEQEYFSDGITEDVITDLSKISALHVVARNTVFTYKGRPIKIQQATHELGVRYILEGSVRKAGSHVRVTAQLIDGKDGGHLWAERYDRELTDIFAIQDDITQAIVDQLKIKLLPEEKRAIATAPTVNVEAYTYYLRGRQFFQEWTKPYLLLARRMFIKAVELDPRYARAYAGIADSESALHVWHSAEVSIESILAMSAKALELDPNLAEAHASRGLALHHGDLLDEAIAEFERALALDPSLYEANFFYARLRLAHGDFADAARLFTRAAEIRPDDYISPLLLLSVCRSLGREADHQRWARIALERSDRALNLHPESPGPVSRGALALAHLGERDRAMDWAARALATDPDDTVTQYNITCMYAVLGDFEQALDVLEKITPKILSPEQISWLRNDSDLDALRNHPRYLKVISAIEARRRPDREPRPA